MATPKAGIKHIQKAGWHRHQFPALEKEDDFESMLNDALEVASDEARHIVGSSTYDAATEGDEHRRIRRAEVHFVAAELWRRKKAYDNESAAQAREPGQASLYAEYERNARAAEERAYQILQQVGRGSGGDSHLAAVTVSSGPIKEAGW